MILLFLRKCILCFLLLQALLPGNPACCQVRYTSKTAGDTLHAILDRLNKAETDSARAPLNAEFSNRLHEILMQEGSDDFVFDEIRTLIKAAADDGHFRIYHWSLTDNGGKKHFYGYLKLLGKGEATVFTLRDYNDSLTGPDTAVLGADHWPGALYYRVITCTDGAGNRYYTLLGLSAGNASVSSKVIDILSFGKAGEPCFGKAVFPDYGDGKRTRVLFRYAAANTMSLKYDEQYLVTGRKWNASKREFEVNREKVRMILFDRLMPLDPLAEGQYQFYVTAGDICDGFRPDHGHWNYVKDLEATNRH